MLPMKDSCAGTTETVTAIGARNKMYDLLDRLQQIDREVSGIVCSVTDPDYNGDKKSAVTTVGPMRESSGVGLFAQMCDTVDDANGCCRSIGNDLNRLRDLIGCITPTTR